MSPSPSPDWQQRAPSPFPPNWASAWGDDRYGLWAEVAVGDVVQRLRWIEQGSFLMGSRDEAQRGDNEGPQHLVYISHGLWLADSACTLALWQAVSGQGGSSAPTSDPQDLQHPVGQVSWDEAQLFLARLALRLPGTKPCLPSVDEWNYACRAGSHTPELVHLEALTPFDLDVKSLPANAWGLYGMYGDVPEWRAEFELLPVGRWLAKGFRWAIRPSRPVP